MVQDQTAPSTTPAVAGTAAPAQTAATVAPQAPSGPYTAREMYEAAQLQRRILRDQLSSAESQRNEIAQELRIPTVSDVDKAGLEQRLKVIDTHILDLTNQLSDARQREAQAAAVPGADQPSAREISNERFEMAAALGFGLTLIVGLPLLVVQLRRLWRKHAVVLSMTPELTQRLDSIDRAVEATAIEIERVGEGQRFVTQLLASRAAEQVQIPRRDS